MPNKRQPKRYSKSYGGSASFSASGYGLAIKANAKANYALSQLNSEKKVLEFSGASNITTTPTVLVLNTLAQGTTSTTRIGDSVRWTSIQFRCRLDGHATVDNIVRLILVRDHNPRGVLPAYTDVYQGTPSTTNVMQYRNLKNINRFDILWDKFYVIPAQNSGSSHVRVIEKYWNLEKMLIKRNYRSKGKGKVADKALNETTYIANTGGIADIGEQGFFFIAVADNTASPIDFDYHFRNRYIDN